MATYTLELVNASSRPRTLCVLPELTAEPVPGVQRLAWLTAEVHRTTRLRITWDGTLDVAWAPRRDEPELPVRRPLAPGDALALVRDDDGVALREWPDAVPGRMRLLVPGSAAAPGAPRRAAPGWLYVLVAGSPALAAPAEPGTDLVLEPPLAVRVLAWSAHPGDPVVVEDVAQSALVCFPGPHAAMRATLCLDNTWAVDRVRG